MNNYDIGVPKTTLLLRKYLNWQDVWLTDSHMLKQHKTPKPRLQNG